MIRLRALLVASVASVFFSASVFAAPFSLSSSPQQALAIVSVGGDTQIVTRADLNEKVQEYKALGVNNSEDDVLDILVNDMVFLMSAKRDGVSVSDAEVDERIRQARVQLEMQLGRELTESEFDEYILQDSSASGSFDEYREELRKAMLVDKYVRAKRGDEVDKVTVISDSEVAAFYRRNRTQFINPEYVRISHIFAEMKDDPAENSRSLERMRSVLSDIKSGIVSFERAVGRYSEDQDSIPRGGDIGTVSVNAASVLGEHFVDVAFTLEPGDIADDVVESTRGYHIIKATAHVDPRFLEIDDYISPDSNITVREYVRSFLQQRKAQDDYADTVNSLVDELKKSARITYSARGEN